ncbi:hypothetical protein QOZ80_5BG0419780 [Eleusine coracana subsp. coracana]|nr:hypothetical protein QOZ80_5BG0419780 [Eleusine coracana subsp. coracana]
MLLVVLLAANATSLVRAGDTDTDTVAAGRPLSGDRKLVSRGGKFALGFFQPEGAAGRWYIGIWYHKIPVRTPVWVANRDSPVSDPAASRLTIAPDGNLVLLDPSGSRAWSTDASARAFGNATVVAVLLDSGNLVLIASRNPTDQVLWQSFDHIGNTWLPGAKLRRDKVTGVIHGAISWRAPWDPVPGPYTLQLDPGGSPQYVLLLNGTRESYWGSGNWNGRTFTDTPEVSFRFVDNDQESYFTYTLTDNSTMYHLVVDVSGQLKGLVWAEDMQAWMVVYDEPKSECYVRQRCGSFGVCSFADAACRCASGSKAKEDTFFLMLNIVYPDDGRVAVVNSSSSGECERACLSDCTCSAYAYSGSCILWHGDLQNLGYSYVGADFGDLYIRLASSDLLGGARSNNKRRTIEIAFGALAIVCFVVVASILIVCKTMSRRRATKVHGLEGCCVASFKYRELRSFTKNFSDKLGGGSFGSVFRGQLPDRTTTIAVKKLEGLCQGEKQFRAEVSTLGTIHHVNLIRLLGFCSDSGNRNKLLVYEYMPSGSLDRHLFGATPHALSWRGRYQVAVGVAKGLCYLHDKCRDCIIHCDVKPENVLLDADFEPKVADFGLAKLMGRDFSRVLTTMRGTIGYLAPEWIGGEPITAKADVYSYGMMLFEIVSGRRNADHGKTESGTEHLSSGVGGSGSDYHAVADEFFPVLVARRLAEAEGDVTALLDPALGGDADAEEVRRVCKVACWCIQDEADARPTMAEVVRVLEGVTDVEVPPVPRLVLVLVVLLAANAPLLVRADDTVAVDRPLSGDVKLVSRGGKFALGFFQPEEGTNGSWYVGIWYHKISVFTPVWVANRDRPVSDPTASRLTIAADGNLVLLDHSGSRAWSTNAISNAKSGNATVVAVLLDTGNLVLAPSRNATDQVLWQNFDHIGDTWLPGAKLRRDKTSAVIQQGMTSWRSRGDPAPGPYTLQPDPSGASQYVISMNGTREHYWASGDWNGETFVDTPEVAESGLYSEFLFATTDRENYIMYTLADNSTVLYRFVMDVSGQVQALLWMHDLQAWNLIYSEPRTRCQVPRSCGAFGVCSESTFDECLCVRGFSPRDAARWDLRDYTGGCVRDAELRCAKNDSNDDSDRFYLMLGVRLPDDGLAATGALSSSGYCERACLDDCTCSAYAFNGSCILWHGDLQNLGHFYVGDLYIRLAASELPGPRSHKKWRTVEIAVSALAIACFVVATSVLIVRTIMSHRRAAKVQGLEGGMIAFTYRELQSFANNFSDKLGGGSFGSVFRGQLPGRTTTIAVKKLEGLWQGEKQFRAEVSTLGMIHHVNLIRLLGFCSDSGNRNKLLVYEYMPNGSLDRHLFRATLSWRVRYQIAVGIAKGLAYLHDKCRDCIIHCDVKPENILLDAEFVPKVADFGLAKLLRRDTSRVLTTMRGTIGYLAPEWISGEPITAKADVYSYGMMLFEIVSGRRNADHGKTESEQEPSLGSDYDAAADEFFPVLVARRLAEVEGDVTALLDSALGGDADVEEARRVCKVACWCIQDEADARPTMAEVVRVLQGVTKIDVPPVPRYLQILAGRWMHTTHHDFSS